MKALFNVQPVTRVPACIIASEQEIQDEPMLYGASVEFAREAGGPITQLLLDASMPKVLGEAAELALKGYHPVIDTKSVMLMPGMYPCIPGWHCDGVIRSSRGEQPNLSTLGELIPHYVCSLSSDRDNHAPTQFVSTSNLVIPDIDEDNVWQSVDSYVNIALPDVHTALSGEVYKIYRDTLHRGCVATSRNWRYFFRLSFYHMPALNQVRKQVQVYTDVSRGW